MSDAHAVEGHYGVEPLEARVAEALQKAGLGEGTVGWAELTPLDQFHVRGLAATKELAQGLGPASGDSVLDVGCGLGGPARFLAANYGCRVTGIDLSQAFVDVARMLTERAELAASVTFRQANALDLPFADATFDHAWTQHVAMNIADRRGLYASIRRVLKPGGRLAIHDVVAGDGRPLTFPVPWAGSPELSILLTPDAMREVLEETGFSVLSWADETETALAWFAEMDAKRPTPISSSPPPLGTHVVMGPRFAEMVGNFRRNLEDGRVRLVQTVLRRDPD